ncbi:Tocopherol cyclase [Dillenia turbinata]|uniref:Tocopherol cyclase n=1 Tax=Dillenia turbinata TaxID=194707 RepID=A0AAN8VGU1_9MAGN
MIASSLCSNILLGFPIKLIDSRHSNSTQIPCGSVQRTNSKLRLRFMSGAVASDSLSGGDTLDSSPSPSSVAVVVEEKETKSGTGKSVKPVYAPTPANRYLRTPHSGYHFDGTTRKFFEGWYFKVSIPECRQSFCFMYSVESPGFRKKLTALEVAQYGPRFTGVGAQILGADDKYICQFSEETQNFWGNRHELMLGNAFVAGKGSKHPNNEVPPETARWEYSTRPVYGWGDVASKQKATAGWLAAFPVFEPHWQICMAGGLSTGWIEWDGKRYEFENAPSYSEKNWGGAFPRKWFWVQCNVFEGANGDIALTAAGGLRQLPGLTETFETAALIGIHYDGTFYEFVPWNGVVSWEMAPWGYWQMFADNGKHVVELEATTNDPGTTLRAPTSEAGLAPACKDTCFGELRLQLWERRYDGSRGKIVLDVTSNMAAVEIGGGPWFNTWKGRTSAPELINRALSVPVDVEGIFNLVPFFKPPGL